jgi:hypothetical protein
MMPALPHDQEPLYFHGQLEDANPAAAAGGGGADGECVAVYDPVEGQWDLEMVTFKLGSRWAGDRCRSLGGRVILLHRLCSSGADGVRLVICA